MSKPEPTRQSDPTAPAGVQIVNKRGWLPSDKHAHRQCVNRAEQRRFVWSLFRRVRPRYETDGRAYEEVAGHPDVQYKARMVREIVAEARREA